MKIDGGYYLKARKLRNSDIAKKPPCYREIWDWLIEQANHSTKGVFPRGSCMRSIRDIQEGLHWMIGYRKMTYKKWQCENALKWLRREGMITTTKTTRGMVIKVDNYKDYQNPKNYEHNSSNNNESNKQTTTPPHYKQECKNVKNVKKSTTSQKQKINFDFNKEVWENITDKDREGWRKAYPACNVDIELKQMREWLLSNPDKRKSRYRRFITNWLSRSQERGGSETKGVQGGNQNRGQYKENGKSRREDKYGALYET